MPLHSENFIAPTDMLTAMQLCHQVALTMGMSVSHGAQQSIIFIEPMSWGFTNPVTIEAAFMPQGDNTQITLTASNMGFGPIQNNHVKNRALTLRQGIEMLINQMGTQPAFTDNPAPSYPPDYPSNPNDGWTPHFDALPPAKEEATKAIFISYRRNDSADVTGRIYDRLVGRFGAEPIFKDVDDIPLGVDFRKHLDAVVGKCRILLAIIGNEWVDAKDAQGRRRLEDAGDFVRIEIESALRREIPVVPLLVRGATMPSPNELPDSLKELAFRNGIPIRHDPDFNTDINRLIKGLEDHLD
jgi:hypothetical protein